MADDDQQDRYAGKPFLRLLESYVLNAIGRLTPQEKEALEAMEDKLSAVYGQTGSWVEIVAAQMAFPVELPGRICKIWETGSARAREQGFTPDPVEFTRHFVDMNFVPRTDSR